MGRLEQIWIKRFHKGPMDSRTQATLVTGRGLVGNADQGGLRQVTILAQERWDELMAQVGGAHDPAVRRANLLVSGVMLDKTRGRALRVGACRLRIAGETRPCNLMEETHAGLRSAMAERWGGGVFAEVLSDGHIGVGDEVDWEDAAAADLREEEGSKP